MEDGGVDEVGGVVAERGVDHVVSKIVSWLWVCGSEDYRPYLRFSRMKARTHMIDGCHTLHNPVAIIWSG